MNRCWGDVIRLQVAQKTRRWRVLISFALALVVTLVAGCTERADSPVEPIEDRPDGVITLGDIEPDEPATRIRRIQPLADLLGERLSEHGIGHGRVVIAHDVAEMARLIRDGKVDFYLDSPFPVLAVNQQAGSSNLLLRQAKEDAEYWTEFVARSDAGVERLKDLTGRVVTFQEPNSTSGFLLPVVALIEQGFSLQPVAQPDSAVDEGQVGCFFSGDEENTIELLLNGTAAIGVVSNQDFRELPEETRDRLTIIGSTDPVPRQLVAVRPGIDPDLTDSVQRILLELTDQDRERMAAADAPRGWTWRFAPLSPSAQDVLADIEQNLTSRPTCATVRGEAARIQSGGAPALRQSSL